jgi:hypothetical protein
MSIDNPPIYIGITYNSQFFVEETGGLSEAQANALYLRKTFPDTATALETFNSGVKTDSISSISTNGNLFNDTGAGTLSSTLCNSNNIIRLGENAKFLNLGYNMPSGDGRYITIGAAASQNTNIAIGGNFTNVVSGFNKIYIGQSGKTVNISGSTINIGTSTSNNYIYNIESPSASTNIDLYSLLAGANLTLCNGQGTGILSLASGTGRSGGVTIMTNGNTPATNELLLGDSTKTVRLRGTFNINSDVNSNIVLGNSSGTNTILLNRPLSLNYPTSAINAINKVGHTTEVFFPNNISLSVNGGNSIATLTIGTAGVFIINFSFRYAGPTTAVGNCESWFFTSTGGTIQYGNQAYYSNPNAFMGSNVICQAGSAVITTTTTSTITFHTFITYTGGIPFLDKTFSYYSYTRLA